MSAGRIETYVHSDATTRNKGGAMVRVACATDFGARTAGFVCFAKRAARLAYAAGAETWQDVATLFPDAEADRSDLARQLKEDISVEDIRILKV